MCVWQNPLYKKTQMKPFDHVPLIKGEIANDQPDDDGMLYAYSKNPKRTVKYTRENTALCEICLLLLLNKFVH